MRKRGLIRVLWVKPNLHGDRMADERRYREDEVNDIIDLALTGDELDGAIETDQDGLTLKEVQEIGLEVGIVPARVADAARSLELRRDVLAGRRSLGMAIEVGRVIDVRREVTDVEWDLIVAEFRNAVGEHGRVMAHGGVREWAAGAFQASLEPTETGHRIRLRTQKEGARVQNALGFAGLVSGSVLLAWIVSGTSPPAVEMAMLMSMASGVGLLVSSWLSLPRWTRLREGQLEHIVDRVSALLDKPTQEPPETA